IWRRYESIACTVTTVLESRQGRWYKMNAPMQAPALLLLGGAPGSVKSTVVSRVAAGRPLALALDVDALKHSLGGWDRDLHASGLQAPRRALARARQQLEDVHYVLNGQYPART